MTNGKIDQIAYYAHNDEQVAQIKRHFGLENAEWIEDKATGIVAIVRPDLAITGKSVGHLRFNYSLGIELEILTYLHGPHWHESGDAFQQGRTFLSHVGIHMASEPGDEGQWAVYPTVQSLHTTEHTNAYVLEKGRKYQYVIKDTRPALGHYTKLIWRIEEGKAHA